MRGSESGSNEKETVTTTKMEMVRNRDRQMKSCQKSQTAD